MFSVERPQKEDETGNDGTEQEDKTGKDETGQQEEETIEEEVISPVVPAVVVPADDDVRPVAPSRLSSFMARFPTTWGRRQTAVTPADDDEEVDVNDGEPQPGSETGDVPPTTGAHQSSSN